MAFVRFTSSTTTHKRKASSSMAAGCRINRKVAVNDEGSTDGIEINDYKPDVAEHPATTSDDKAGDTEPEQHTNLTYASTKAMGDADREVRLSLSL